ncbi:MAG: hypothetical protein E4G89_04770 [Methanothrix sp.]|nr:MAG: hypothetical protein E4G89_04770 [Methanothrix sp.]
MGILAHRLKAATAPWISVANAAISPKDAESNCPAPRALFVQLAVCMDTIGSIEAINNNNSPMVDSLKLIDAASESINPVPTAATYVDIAVIMTSNIETKIVVESVTVAYPLIATWNPALCNSLSCNVI